jgi:hypothetical protein
MRREWYGARFGEGHGRAMGHILSRNEPSDNPGTVQFASSVASIGKNSKYHSALGGRTEPTKTQLCVPCFAVLGWDIGVSLQTN